MRIPSPAEIQALHEKHAPTPEAFTLVHTHCEIVWGIAEQLLSAPHLAHLDAELVRAGCLLHDIGVYRLYGGDGRLDHENYIRHGLLGHEILAAEGFPETLRRFCSHHTGVPTDQNTGAFRDLGGQRPPAAQAVVLDSAAAELRAGRRRLSHPASVSPAGSEGHGAGLRMRSAGYEMAVRLTRCGAAPGPRQRSLPVLTEGSHGSMLS